jgi:mono/diheme cytochrome c family protein
MRGHAGRLGLGFGLGIALSVAACGESPPRFTAPMTLGGAEVSADVLNRGERVFMMYCATCHGEDGSGKGPAANALTTKPRDFREADFKYVAAGEGNLPTDADLDLTIRKGRLETGMPAWNGLVESDRHAVIQFIKTLSPRWRR